MTTPLPIPDVPPAQASAVLCGPWATPADVPEKWRQRASDDQWVTILRMAAEILFSMTGEQWRGTGCEQRMELRSRPHAGDGVWPSPWVCGCWSVMWQANYTSVASAWLSRPGWAGIHPHPVAVQLDADATAVTEVTLADGTVLDPTAYRLSGAGWLERIDGKHWSVCGPTGPTTITYSRGMPPPLGGIIACVNFAIEMVKSWSGEACAIPQTATQVTRQGLSVQIDPTAFLKDHRTGVIMVDQWIESVNPLLKGGGRRRREAQIWSPDLPTGTRIGPPA